MSETFCKRCANMTWDDCYVILENCTLRAECNKFDKVFGDSSRGGTTSAVLLVSAVILFVFLLLNDGLKGFKIRAHWIPGDFLVLSALTIELLNLISTQGEPLNWERRILSLNEFWMIHTSRIMLCVVIAYLVPAMANPGAEDFWGKIVSLALTVFLHVISELYFINPKSASSILKALWPIQQRTSFRLYYILAALIFSSFCMLLFLLACANIAGRGIERIIAKKVRLIFREQAEEDGHRQQHLSHEDAEEDHHRCQKCWKRVEDALLRAWIVARAYSLEYVVARSALASSSAIIVTFQIAITIVAGVLHSPKLALCNARDRLRFSVTMLQCVFILIGWSMILWRWVTAVAYYGSWSSRFRIEDFWTRHLRESQQSQKYELPLSQLLHAKIEKLVVNQSTKITLPRLLLYAVIWLQLFIVSFSKVCLLVSQIPFCNKLKDKLVSSKLSELVKDNCKYKKMLEGVQMLGETPNGLWLSNRQSIKNAETLVSQGRKCNCEDLVEFLARKRTDGRLGLSCLEPNKPQPGFKYLCKGTQQPPEEEFAGISRKPWKMTAVSLLSIIVQLSPICAETEKEQPSTSPSFPPKVVNDCLEAYSQAWEIIDFVDKADTEPDEMTSEAADEITSEAADETTSEAADMYFDKLRKKGNSGEVTVSHKVTEALVPLRTESKRKTETPASLKTDGLKGKDKTQGCPQRWNGTDSMDWNAEAWGSAVYKLCNSIQYNEDTDVNVLLKELESSLADIINECLEKTQHLLMLNCRKWAIKNDEREIAKALFTAGKASKIIEILKTKERSGSAIVQHLG